MSVPNQVATQSRFDFGAAGTGNPAAANRVLNFKVKRGGNIVVEVANPDNADMIVSFRVSADGTTYAALTAAANLSLVTNITVAAKTNKVYEVQLRQGIDNYFDVLATGGVRGVLNVNGAALLEPLTF